MGFCGRCGNRVTERDILASAYRGWSGVYCPGCLDEIDRRDKQDVTETKDEYRRIVRKES